MRYVISSQGQNYGPFAAEDLSRFMAEGRLAANDRVWDLEGQEWVSAISVHSLPIVPEAAPPRLPARPSQPQPSAPSPIGLQKRRSKFWGVLNTDLNSPKLAPFFLVLACLAFLSRSKFCVDNAASLSTKDPHGVVEALRGDVVDPKANVDVDLALMLALARMRGEEVRQDEPLRLVSVTNGFGTVKGRRLPATIVFAELQTVNRVEAKYRSTPFCHGRILDKEFGLWRALFSASGETADQKLQAWKADVSFSTSE